MEATIRSETRTVASLKANPRNARTHSRKQVRQIEKSIREFGFTNPILCDEDDIVIAGHGRLQAALNLGLDVVPVNVIRGLTPTQKRALVLADNKIAGNAGWDRELLALELSTLSNLDGFDIGVTGFDIAEIDQILLDHETKSADPGDDVPDVLADTVTQPGDLWLLGKHRLFCGDARSESDVHSLCHGDLAAMAFLDAPYNVAVSGIVGRGRIKHPEFAMGSGEMTDAEFLAFLTETHRNAAHASRDGALHYSCMDWRGIRTLIQAGEPVYDDMLNLIVWNKLNAGQGSFYRSQHELIGVFRVGTAPHLNNVELGKHGRNRSNVWTYAGVNSFGKDRLQALASHPTVKPVVMIAEAIKDCTKQGDYVLDLFGGSGSTLLAAERVGRKALLLEIEPRFVDVAIRRWQAFTGRDAVHAETRAIFDDRATLTGRTS